MSAAELDARVRDALRAQPGGLTSDQVASRAVATSPQVEVMRAELMINASSVDSTIAQFAPEVELSATYSRISPADIDFGSGGASVGAANEGPLSVDPDTNMVVDSTGTPVMAAEFGPIEVPLNNYSLRAALSVPFSDYASRLVPAKRGSQAQTDAVALQRDAEKVKAELEARLAYYDWLRAIAQVAVLERTVEEFEARLVDAQVGLDAGVLTRADLHQLEGALANAETGLHQARSFRKLSQEQLGVIMAESGHEYRVGEDVLGDRSDPWAGQAPETLLDEAHENRLELAALGRTSEAMRQARRAAASAYYPRLDGFAEFTYANPNQRFFPATDEWNGSWVLGVTLSWRLSSFLQARSNVKKARGNERKSVASAAAMERAIELELRAAWEERERAAAAIELSERARVAAERAYEQQVALFQGGELSANDLLAGGTSLMNATLRHVNARIDLRVADLKLQRATGRMKPMETPDDADDARYERVGRGGRK